MATKTRKDPVMEKKVKALMAFFTGSDVGEFSAKLQVGGHMGEQARRYFDAREALGLRGWDCGAQAEESIRTMLMIR